MARTRTPNYYAALPARIALWVVENPYGKLDQCAKELGFSYSRIIALCGGDDFIEAVIALDKLIGDRPPQFHYDAGLMPDPDCDYEEFDE